MNFLFPNGRVIEKPVGAQVTGMFIAGSRPSNVLLDSTDLWELLSLDASELRRELTKYRAHLSRKGVENAKQG